MKIFSDIFKSLSLNNKTNITQKDIESFDDEKILSICIFLIEVSKSDYEYDDFEKSKIIDLLKKEFSLNYDQIKLVITLADQKNNEMISLHDFTEIVNNECSYSEKKDLIKMLWDVSYADGRIDKYEDYTIRKISDLLYIKHADFIKAKLR